MTPQLQMAIKLLQLSRLELVDTIRQELEENPALEEVQETAALKTGRRSDRNRYQEKTNPPTKEVTIEEKIHEDIDWSNYLDEYNTPGRINFETESRETPQLRNFYRRKRILE